MKRRETRSLEVESMRSVVMGGGESGRAAALLLASRGARVVLLDRDGSEALLEWTETASGKGVEVRIGAHSAEDFADAELIVMSPGIPVRKVEHLFPEQALVLSELELAWRLCDIPVLAVTGTNGKTTTVTLCKALLEAAGKSVFLGGNIGTPLSSFVLEGGQADVLVLEASSFQLQTSPCFAPQAAVLLNLTIDHQDYHQDMDEYLDAKWSMFEHQESGDLAVLPQEMREELRDRLNTSVDVSWFRGTDRIPAPRLPGAHNQANMEAAMAACAHFGVDQATAFRVFEQFVPGEHGLKHRLECFLERDGVLFVDDSKATTVDSLRAALMSFSERIRLLAGGKYKGGDLQALAPLIRERVVSIGLFGGAEEVFRTAWEGLAPLTHDTTLAQALERQWQEARSGDVILLSPATASFDQYENYEERGHDFQATARSLQ